MPPKNIKIGGSRYYTVKPGIKIIQPSKGGNFKDTIRTTTDLFKPDDKISIDPMVTVDKAIFYLLTNTISPHFIDTFTQPQYKNILLEHNHTVNALLLLLQDIDHKKLLSPEQKGTFESRLQTIALTEERGNSKKIITTVNQIQKKLEKIVKTSIKDIEIQPKTTNSFEFFENQIGTSRASIRRYQSFYILKTEQFLKILGSTDIEWVKNIPQEIKNDCINQLKQITVFKDIKAFKTQEKGENSISKKLNVIQEKLMGYYPNATVQE